MNKILSYLIGKLFSLVTIQGEKVEEEYNMEYEFFLNTHCKRHGGRAYFVNCDDCIAESHE